MGIEFLINQIINGLQRGSIYALIALGYTLVYGVLRFINFAHGEVYMIGAFVGFFVAHLVGASFVPAVACAMGVCAALGVAIELVAYRPLRQRPRLSSLITAIGVSFFLSNLVAAIHFQFRDHKGDVHYFSGASFTGFPVPTLIQDARYPLLPGLLHEVYVTKIQILNIGVALLLMVGLWLLVRKTMLGKAMRACANNMESLALMGVDVNRVISFTFAIGAALAGAAALLNCITYPRVTATMGLLPGLKAFVAAVLGGIGSVPGAMLGGFIMGLAEVAAYAALPSSPVDYTPLADGVAFAILILVLIVRPTGICGEVVSEKV